ncbi:MAG TPA: HAD family hydrolase [Candidatus Binatia bacterium]|jgi:phosphoglycolate phosphatase-like HAD superfamily hydrolase
MKLAVFDIDGTLTLGDGLGTRCFFECFDAVFGAGFADRRLDSYVESTDCGIAREAARRALGRHCSDAEFVTFKAAYLESLEAEIGFRDRAYRPIDGADGLMQALASAGGWTVAIATGNWRRAAHLKLACARIEAPVLAAFSEDGTTRTEVLARAVAIATQRSGAAFERIVYVGDQPWDLGAARDNGVAFVGVGSGERAARLQGHGATVIAGYRDTARFLSMLESA